MSAAATAAGYLYASGRLRKTTQGETPAHASKARTGDLTPKANTRPFVGPSGRPILGLPKRK